MNIHETKSVNFRQRRDVGIHLFNRWAQVIGIWGIFVPIMVSMTIAILIFAIAGISSIWIFIFGWCLGLIISAVGLTSMVDTFFISVRSSEVAGTQNEIFGSHSLDSGQYRILNLYFGGTHPKMFYEREQERLDLSRDNIVTISNIPNHGRNSVKLPTRDGAILEIQAQFNLAPDNIQKYLHSGGKDASKLVNENTGETRRDRNLKEIFAPKILALASIIRKYDADTIFEHLDGLIYEWANLYIGRVSSDERRYGVKMVDFQMIPKYSDEIVGRIEQEMAKGLDLKAMDKLLRPLGLTTDTSLWGKALPGGVKSPLGHNTWQPPSDSQMKWAQETVQIDSGQAKMNIDRRQIQITFPDLDPKTVEKFAQKTGEVLERFAKGGKK